MRKFIVDASNEVEGPQYLKNCADLLKMKDVLGNDMYFSPLVENHWPLPEQLGLDESQYIAFQAGLTKEFAIIQGPPGTGKTYLGSTKIFYYYIINSVVLFFYLLTRGLRMVEVMLQNLPVWKDNNTTGPILVVCYTNHALDQFLEGIHAIFGKLDDQKTSNQLSMIRIGGRCQSSVIEPFNLRSVIRRHHRELPSNYFNSRRAQETVIADLQYNRSTLMNELKGLTDPQGILKCEIFLILFAYEMKK